MNDCEFTQDDVCSNLNTNVDIKKLENGETTLTIKRYDSGAYDLLSRESTKDRYLTTEKTSYNFNTNDEIISALIKIFEDKNNNRVVYIYDSYLDQNYKHLKTAFEQRSEDTTRFNTQRLNKDFFIKITDALKAYCKLPTDTQGPRFNMETFQKAIEAVDVLYPSIKLYSIVFQSGFCASMGGRKSRKTRKQRKARKTRKSRRTKRRTRRTRRSRK
jgi:hypothetical protein